MKKCDWCEQPIKDDKPESALSELEKLERLLQKGRKIAAQIREQYTIVIEQIVKTTEESK